MKGKNPFCSSIIRYRSTIACTLIASSYLIGTLLESVRGLHLADFVSQYFGVVLAVCFWFYWGYSIDIKKENFIGFNRYSFFRNNPYVWMYALYSFFCLPLYLFAYLGIIDLEVLTKSLSILLLLYLLLYLFVLFKFNSYFYVFSVRGLPIKNLGIWKLTFCMSCFIFLCVGIVAVWKLALHYIYFPMLSYKYFFVCVEVLQYNLFFILVLFFNFFRSKFNFLR